MPFRLTVDGRSWLTEDLTVDEAKSIEEELGESWAFAIAQPLKTAKHGEILVRTFLAREHSADDAAKQAGAMTMRQLIDAVDLVTENGAVVDPKAVVAEPGASSGPSDSSETTSTT